MVSFIVPAFNAGKFLGDAITSIRAQAYDPHEIVVVDDGSTDNTSEIAQSFEGVRLFRQSNQGAASARNHAVREARGELLSFADADDQMVQGKTICQVKHLMAHPNTKGCIGLMENYADGGEVLPDWATGTSKQGELMALATLVVWRTVFLEVGFFNESMKVGSDFDWMIRARDAGMKVDILRETLIRRRVHSENLSKNSALQRKLLLHSFKDSMQRRRAAGS